MLHTMFLASVSYPAFADPAPIGAPATPPTSAPPTDGDATDSDIPPPVIPKKSMSQDEVNKLLADDRRKHQEQTKKALTELESLKSKAKLTQEERDELDKRIQQMHNDLLTKDQLAAKERERLTKKHDEAVTSLSKERDNWKDRYTNASIRRAITDAAATLDAYNPAQIVALLGVNTRLVDKLDAEGKPTGEFIPKVRFDDTDKEGKAVTLELDPGEAVKRMKELDQYQNLFKGTGVGGLGSNNTPKTGKMDVKKLATDPQAYRDARKAGKLKFDT